MMEIGVVVHGPMIIDSGYALKIIEFLSNFADVRCRLGGTMGRTAVIDAAMEDKIDVSKRLVPSDSLSLFADEDVSVIFLLNYGKSATTGHVFGYKVVHHYMDKSFHEDIPLIQIERPGEEDGTVVIWNCPDNLKDSMDELVLNIEDTFHIKRISPKDIETKHFGVDDTVKIQEDQYESNADIVKRRVHGVSPGENILVNGNVIGKSDSSSLTLVSKDGIIVDIIGGEIKQHGVDKLGKIDLNTAIVKTGLLRRSKVRPRVINHKSDKDVYNIGFLDHAAEDVYSYRDMDLIVTVGDDTTLLGSDILFRFKIPIIGITDGDLDKVVEDGYKSNDSVIFQVNSGYDDKVGHRVYVELFNKSNHLIINRDSNDLKNVIQELSDEITYIIEDMDIEYTKK